MMRAHPLDHWRRSPSQPSPWAKPAMRIQSSLNCPKGYVFQSTFCLPIHPSPSPSRERPLTWATLVQPTCNPLLSSTSGKPHEQLQPSRDSKIIAQPLLITLSPTWKISDLTLKQRSPSGAAPTYWLTSSGARPPWALSTRRGKKSVGYVQLSAWS